MTAVILQVPFAEILAVKLCSGFLSYLQLAHGLLQESGSTQLRLLSFLAQQDGVWSNSTLSGILSNQIPHVEQGQHFLVVPEVMIRNLTSVQ